jgi:outer membrane biosynthesis protein TonB
MYSDNKHQNSNTYLQGANSLEGLLFNNGTRLAFDGHAHFYQRSMVNGNTIYTTGGTGVKLVPIDSPCSSTNAYGLGWSSSKNKGYACGAASVPTSKLQVHHYILVNVNGDTLTVSPMNALGQVFDQQVFNFGRGGNPTPTPTPAPTDTPEGPTATPTPTPAPTDTPEGPTATPTPTPAPTDTPEGPTATPTPTSVPTDTPEGPTPTPTPTSVPTDTPEGPTTTPTPTSVPTDTPEGPTTTPTLAATPTSTSSGSYVFQDGFESGNMSAWTSSAGLTVQSSVVQNGSFATQGNTTNGNTYAKKTLPSTFLDAYSRIYFNLLSYSSQVNVLRYRTATDSNIAYLFINTAGKLGLRNEVAGTTYTSATSVSGGWHSLELHVTINGASSATEVWLDGVRIDDLSVTTNLGSTPVGRFQIGEVQSGRTYNVVFDNTVFNDQRIYP